MKDYHRLSEHEREKIFIFYYQGQSLRQIAARLNRSPSTISREMKRNREHEGYYGYQLIRAQMRSEYRSRSRRRGKSKINQNEGLRNIVLDKLQNRWSPEQISRYLWKTFPEDPRMQVSHESIYTYIYVYGRGQLKKSLHTYLRHQKTYRRAHKKNNRGKIPEMISIEERPKEVADRTVPGHWEGDLILGKEHKNAIGTIVERTTRYVILVHLKSRLAPDVRKAFAREIKRLPMELRRSMTYDQGKEMSQHRLFTEDTKMRVYFAHPHSPWERGTNENTNMLIRDFFPKGTDFGQVSRYKLKKVQDLLNDRPRKVLDWDSPQVVFSKLIEEFN